MAFNKCSCSKSSISERKGGYNLIVLRAGVISRKCIYAVVYVHTCIYIRHTRSFCKYEIRLLSAASTIQTSSAAEDEYCKQKEIKDCLKPLHDFLEAHSQNKKTLMLTSLEHAMELLTGDAHAHEIHISSLSVILLPLDQIIVAKASHPQLCRFSFVLSLHYKVPNACVFVFASSLLIHAHEKQCHRT